MIILGSSPVHDSWYLITLHYTFKDLFSSTYKNDLMHPQNHLNDLFGKLYQPRKNKTGISLIKILGVRGEWKEAHIGGKNKF